MNIDSVFLRHKNIAFQLSGGKDSAALLVSMRAYWHLMTVYHLDTGDMNPETSKLVDMFAEMVPNFIRIESDVFLVKAKFGIPTDVLPWSSAAIAYECNAGSTQLMQDRVACCARSIMIPLHQRMKDDGITLIIRGQKSADEFKGPLMSGEIADGFEFLYPFEGMTDEECFSILRENEIAIPDYYSHDIAGDCLGCTAWNNGGSRAAYLRKEFPVHFINYRSEMLSIAYAVQSAASGLFEEANECLDGE